MSLNRILMVFLSLLVFYSPQESLALDILACAESRGFSLPIKVGKDIDGNTVSTTYIEPYNMTKIEEARKSTARCASLFDGRMYYIKVSGLKVGLYGGNSGGLFTYFGVGSVEGSYYGLRAGAGVVIGATASVFATNGGIATFTSASIQAAGVDISALKLEVVDYVAECFRGTCDSVKTPTVVNSSSNLNGRYGGLGPKSRGPSYYQHDEMAKIYNEQKTDGYLVTKFFLNHQKDPKQNPIHVNALNLGPYQLNFNRIKFNPIAHGAPANIALSPFFQGHAAFWMIDEYGRFVLSFTYDDTPYFAMAHRLKDSKFKKLLDTQVLYRNWVVDTNITIQANIFDASGKKVGRLHLTD